MRMDSANRSFAALMGFSLLLGMYVLCGALGSVLVPLVLARAAHGGIGALLSGVDPLLPALLFILLVATGVALGLRSLARQVVACCALARRVRALSLTLPDELAIVSTQVGLHGRVVLVDAPEWFSFVYGALSPRVAVSRGLIEGVSPDELRAVLEHERYHVCNLDPLKIVLVRALSTAFFFLPALASLRVRYVAARELAADRRAMRVCGRRPLASALLKVVRGPEWTELQVATAIGDPELLDVRVVQLETGRQPKLAAPSITRAAISLLGAVVFASTFLLSVFGFGGPTAVLHTTGTGLGAADMLGGLSCAIPFAGGGLLAYWAVSRRARRPLNVVRD
jgi:Zn-dependent protease with chaperone function